MLKQIAKSLFMVIAVAILVPALASAGGHKGKDFMKKIDTNGDGQISAEEHASAAAERFKKMDANGDGVATKKEMKALRKAHKGKYKDDYKKKGECKEDRKKCHRSKGYDDEDE
ncbi:MAG: hypothetical protein R8M46_09260 [Ghiorsea sp.]